MILLEDAGRKADGFLWRVGDALLAECGPPGRHGVNTGAKDRLKKVAAELKRAGLGGNWSLAYLRTLRATAAAFADAKRLASVSWGVHLTAGKPDMLMSIVEQAKAQDEPLTVAVAKKLKRQIEADAKPEPNRDRAKAAIVEARAIREAASIEQKIKALQRDLKPHLNLIDPERADEIVLGWMAVIMYLDEQPTNTALGIAQERSRCRCRAGPDHGSDVPHHGVALTGDQTNGHGTVFRSTRARTFQVGSYRQQWSVI
jgi:hypothetical protein